MFRWSLQFFFLFCTKISMQDTPFITYNSGNIHFCFISLHYFLDNIRFASEEKNSVDFKHLLVRCWKCLNSIGLWQKLQNLKIYCCFSRNLGTISTTMYYDTEMMNYQNPLCIIVGCYFLNLSVAHDSVHVVLFISLFSYFFFNKSHSGEKNLIS